MYQIIVTIMTPQLIAWLHTLDSQLEEWFQSIFPPAQYDFSPSKLFMNTPIVPVPPQNAPATPPVPSIDTLIPDWTNHANARHNVRVLCDLEGLTEKQKNDLSQTVHCESNYNIECVHPNIVNGQVSSTDYGICQINDYWHIGTGKDFPSVAFVMANPEATVRFMCKQFKAGNARAWVCYLKNMYLNYSS